MVMLTSIIAFKVMQLVPRLVWLSGLSTTISHKFVCDWAHAWVAGQVPSWGCARGN